MKTLFLFIFSFIVTLNSAFSESEIKYKVDEVRVFKSENKMQMLYKGKVTKEYEVMLGRGGDGPKEQDGDKKTPEGKYFLTFKNAKSQFYKAIKVTYPNKEDKRRAKELGVSPGGDIFIHGMPNKRFASFLFGNWTQGCIAVTNADMDEIWNNIKTRVPITILP